MDDDQHIFLDTLDKFPHLWSPMTLARHDLGSDYTITPHIRLFDRTFLDLAAGGVEQAIVNSSFRSSKTITLTKYGSAWYLLWHPEHNVKAVAYGQELADEWGTDVRDLLRRYGPAVGLRIRRDTDSKKFWRIDGHRGSFQALSRGSALMGKGYHLGIIDDLVKDSQEAMSKAINETNWDWFLSTFLTRRDPGARVLVNMVRWGITDITARILAHARQSGTNWIHIVIRARAEPDDCLGRRVGELLWPPGTPMYQRTVDNIRDIEHTRWFQPNFQQRAIDEEGKFFKPGRWPRYVNIGDAYALPATIAGGGSRQVVLHSDCLILITVDWAWSESQDADFSAIGVFALTPGERLLVLEVVNEHLALERLAPAIAAVCRRWTPQVVAIEVGHPTLKNEVRRYSEIPEPRWLERKGKGKLWRALPAIVAGENGRILLPAAGEQGEPPWLEAYKTQLAAFSGLETDQDDMVDITSDAADQMRQLTGGAGGTSQEPEAFGPGREVF